MQVSFTGIKGVMVNKIISTSEELEKTVNSAMSKKITGDRFAKEVAQSNLTKKEALDVADKIEKNSPGNPFSQMIRDLYARLAD